MEGTKTAVLFTLEKVSTGTTFTVYNIFTTQSVRQSKLNLVQFYKNVYILNKNKSIHLINVKFRLDALQYWYGSVYVSFVCIIYSYEKNVVDFFKISCSRCNSLIITAISNSNLWLLKCVTFSINWFFLAMHFKSYISI